MKKLLSLVLVLSLVLGSLSMALAAPVDVTDENTAAAVERLMALGIVNGYTDGTYRPERIVTRAEMAKLLVVAMGLEGAVKYAGYESSFSDVKAGDWFNAYVNVATSEGIIKGYTDGTFRPENTVKFEEAITMLVRALGYTDELIGGTWPTNYIVKGSKLNITDGVDFELGGANRGDVAQLLDNTLFVEKVDVEGKIIADATLIADLVDEQDKELTVIEITEDGIKALDEADEIEASIDMTKYLGDTIKVYVKDDSIVYVSEVTSKNMEIKVKENDTTAKTVTYEKDADTDVVLSYTDAVKVVWNGLPMTMAEATAMDNFVGSTVKAVYTVDADKNPVGITFIVGESFQNPVIVADDYDYDADDEDQLAFFESELGIQLTSTTDDDDVVTIDTVVTGDVSKLEDIKANDVLYAKVNTDNEAIEIFVVRDAVTGVVEEVAADDSSIVVDGAKLDVSADIVGSLAVSSLDADDNAISQYLILDKDGKVIKQMNVPGEETPDADTLSGVVLAIKHVAATTDDWGKAVDAINLIKVLLGDGTEVVLDVADATAYTPGDVVTYDDAADADGIYTVAIETMGTAQASINLVDGTVVYMVDTTDGVKVTETTWSNVETLAGTIAYYEAETTGFNDVNFIYVAKAQVTEKVTTDTTPNSVVIGKSNVIGGIKFSVLENGVEKVYNSEDLVLADLTVGNFYEVTIVDGKATTVAAVTYDVANTTVSAIDASRIKLGATIYNFAEEVTVYDFRTADEYTVAKLADIVKDEVKVSIILDEDGNVDTVVITEDIE